MAVRLVPRGASLELHGVHKSFGDNQVLKGVSLCANPGEFIALVGRSGCGKSTLLRLTAGLDTPTEGEIILNGKPVVGLSSTTRVMFQDARLLPWKRVLDNVMLGLKQDARERATRALEHVGLADRAHDWPAILSGGQRQRVALARALAYEPNLLLLDEPLGALDALTRLEMQSLIERLWQEQQSTALLVTHDVVEAVALADRVVVLEEGRVALNCRVDLPRPRHRSDSTFSSLTEAILDCIMQRESSIPRQNPLIAMR